MLHAAHGFRGQAKPVVFSLPNIIPAKTAYDAFFLLLTRNPTLIKKKGKKAFDRLWPRIKNLILDGSATLFLPTCSLLYLQCKKKKL